MWLQGVIEEGLVEPVLTLLTEGTGPHVWVEVMRVTYNITEFGSPAQFRHLLDCGGIPAACCALHNSQLNGVLDLAL